MSKLTQEKIDVLDKLYNIKGEKSVVTAAIKTKIEKKEADIATTTTEKDSVIEEQLELEKELQLFIEQTDKFLATFGNFDNTTFSSFQSIGIDLAIGDALATLRQKAPGHEDNLEDRIKSLKEKVQELSEKIASIEEKKNEFIATLNSAEEAKEKLNDLIEDILKNDNDAYPRKYVKDVLESLCYFSAEEITMLEFLILFKEEGLQEYDDGYELRGNKFEQSLNPKEEVMLTGDIFANDVDIEETEAAVVTDEPKPVTPTVSLAPTNGILTPVAKTEEEKEETVVDAFKEKKEPVIEVEETTGGIFAEETPVDADEVNDVKEEVKEEPVTEEIAPEITPESGVVPEEPEEEKEETKAEEVSPRQPLGDIEEDKKEEESKPKIDPEIISKAQEAGLDLTKADKDDLNRIAIMLADTDNSTLNLNHELLRSINVSDSAIYKVYDEESGER